MSDARCPGPELVLLAAHDLLDDDDDGARAHVDGCAACRALGAALERELAPPPPTCAPEALLPGLRARLAALDPRAPVADLALRLLCTYCRGGLERPDAAYCAGCLAPHHADCFAEHGRCAAPGCHGLEVVRTAPPPPARPRRARAWLLLGSALAAAAGGGAVAALVARPPAPLPVALPAPAPEAQTLRVEVHALDEVLPALAALPAAPDEASDAEPPWLTEYRGVLASRGVTLNFPGTTLSDVVAFMRDITGLNVVVGPGVDPDALQVSLRVRRMALDDALRLVAGQAGLVVGLRDEAIVLGAPGASRVVDPRFPPSRPQPPPPPREALLRRAAASITRDLVTALGEGALRGPAGVDLTDEGRLRVTQTDAGHRVVQAWLEGRRGAAGQPWPEELVGAWFAPAPGPPEHPTTNPDDARARRHARALDERRVDLSVEGPLGEALVALAGLLSPDLPLRVDPAARAATASARLQLRNVSAGAALRHLLAHAPTLVLDVDRDGLRVRPHDVPSLEQRLATARRRVRPDEAAVEVAHRLESSRIAMNLDQRPLTEALNFVQDVTGLNIILDPRAPGDARVSLRVEDVSVAEALDALLAPRGLGVRLAGEVLHVGPRREASLRPELAARPSPGGTFPAARALDVGALALELERLTGARVSLWPGADACRGRVLVPAAATVAEALTLAEAQMGLRGVWTWLDGSEEPLLLLRADEGDGPLARAGRRLGQEGGWPEAPATARAALEGTRSRLREALTALARADQGADVATLRSLLERTRQADRALEEVLAGRSLLGADLGAPREAVAGVVADLVLQRWEVALADLRRATSERQVEESERALAAAQAEGERQALTARHEALVKERDLVRRDASLEAARAESRAAQLEARLRDLGGVGPGLLSALAAARAALIAGRAWDEVFPGGWSAWWQAEQERAAEALCAGAARFHRAGFWSPDTDEGGVAWRGAEAPSEPGEPGWLVVAVDGAPVVDLLDVVEPLGSAWEAGAPRTLTLVRGDARREVRVVLGD
ncbi:MAG: hypothetical protein M9894_21035 [Planctomycetes bacterium]|nr:hypothetical protein [Planctomycetota bacterium]